MLIAQTEAEELPSVSVNPYFSFGPVTKAVSELKQQLNDSSNDELVKVAKTGEREDSSDVSMFTEQMQQGIWLLQCDVALISLCYFKHMKKARWLNVFSVFAVNKMTFCELEDSKKKQYQSIKSESVFQEHHFTTCSYTQQWMRAEQH